MKLRALIIREDGPQVIEVENDYRAFKEELGITSPVDCVTRNIGGKEFDLWVDDEGLFKDDLVIRGINNEWEEMLMGDILILNSKDGQCTSLSTEDILLICDNLKRSVADRNVTYNCSMGQLSVKLKKGSCLLSYGA